MRIVSAFNTVPSEVLSGVYQAKHTSRRPSLVYCGDDGRSKDVAARLIRDAGFEPVDVGGLADAAVMEAPRRPGAVYGEEYRPADARAVAEAVRAGRPIPPTPAYT